MDVLDPIRRLLGTQPKPVPAPDPQRMAIANMLGGASPQGGRFKLPELGKGMMSMGLGGPQAPVQREIMPLPVTDQALLPLLAEGAPTGQETASGGNVQPISTNTPNVQPMAQTTGTVAQANPMPFIGTPQPPIESGADPRMQPFIGTPEPVTPWVEPRASRFFG